MILSEEMYNEYIEKYSEIYFGLLLDNYELNDESEVSWNEIEWGDIRWEDYNKDLEIKKEDLEIIRSLTKAYSRYLEYGIDLNYNSYFTFHDIVDFVFKKECFISAIRKYVKSLKCDKLLNQCNEVLDNFDLCCSEFFSHF